MTSSRIPGRFAALVAALALVAAVPAAHASSVPPATVSGNPTCSELNSGWADFRPADLNPSDGTYGDGTVSVTISNDTRDSFDWSSTQAITAVIVSTTGQANVYGYDPGSSADTGLASPGTDGISRIDFCYQEHGASSGGDQQQVLGERFVGGTAKLSAPRSCVTRRFSARVTGRGISRAVFVLDGNRVASLTRPNAPAGAYSLRINPRRYSAGVHRLSVRVEFKLSSHTRPKLLRAAFQRCGSRK